MAAWTVCGVCGVVVANADLHTAWHDNNDTTTEVSHA